MSISQIHVSNMAKITHLHIFFLYFSSFLLSSPFIPSVLLKFFSRLFIYFFVIFVALIQLELVTAASKKLI